MDAPNPLSATDKSGFWLNRLRDCAAASIIRPGRGYLVRRTPQGTVLDIQSGVGGVGQPATVNIQLYQVNSDPGAPASLIGTNSDPTLGYIIGTPGTMSAAGVFASTGATVAIAKPFDLRQMPFAPAFIHPAYVQTRAPYLASPLVIPPAVAGPAVAIPQYIWAIQNPLGGTGVPDPADITRTKQCTWLDLNIDGRQWGYVKSVCIGGVAMLQVYVASIPYIPLAGQTV